jgi:hypothetical protein
VVVETTVAVVVAVETKTNAVVKEVETVAVVVEIITVTTAGVTDAKFSQRFLKD